MHSLLNDFLVFTLAAIVFVPLFRYFKLGAILAYLTAGIIIGPYAVGLIKDPDVILHFSELGVVFLLFIIGLELAPEKLWSLRRAIFGLGLLQVVLTGLVFMGIGLLLGLNTGIAFVAGFGLALSSTAFSVQLMQENRQLNTSFGQGAFSILMFQDLAVVPLMLSLAFFTNESGTPFSWFMLLKIVGIIFALILLGRFVIPHILRFIAASRTQEVFTGLSLAIVIGTALLLESVGLSMGMGAFLAGVLLANSEYRHEIEVNLQPFKGLLLGLFFIAVGMSLNLKVLLQNPLIVLALTISFIIVKIGIVYLIAKYLFRFSKESALTMAFLLSQGGEFAFVLFNTAVLKNIMNTTEASVLNAAVTISMGLTPLLYFINQKYLRTSSELGERPFDEIELSGSEVIIAGFGRFGQIVARVLKAENIPMTILDRSTEQVDTARKFRNKVFYGDASRKDLLEAAGAKTASYFVLAIDDVESSIETAKTVREYFPNLNIIARARNRRHAMELMELGIKNIHRETLLTSLEVAKELLLFKGRDREVVNKKLERFVNHDEEVLRQQFHLRNDNKQFVSYTIQAAADLENVLKADDTSIRGEK
jgi:monovalent cation:proton antiporter-2 (CPA2) family protein